MQLSLMISYRGIKDKSFIPDSLGYYSLSEKEAHFEDWIGVAVSELSDLIGDINDYRDKLLLEISSISK